jgi:hypothetical protein
MRRWALAWRVAEAIFHRYQVSADLDDFLRSPGQQGSAAAAFAGGRHLRDEAGLRQPKPNAGRIALLLDPTLFQERLYKPARIWERRQFHPAGAAQILHELAFAVVG